MFRPFKRRHGDGLFVDGAGAALADPAAVSEDRSLLPHLRQDLEALLLGLRRTTLLLNAHFSVFTRTGSKETEQKMNLIK